MPIIAEVGRRSWKIGVLILCMYLVLAILGVAMVYPFLMTLTASTTNSLDYNRFSPAPRSLWSRSERFVRGIVPFYPETFRNGMEQFALAFNKVPGNWNTWKAIGEDYQGMDRFAGDYLALAENPVRWKQVQLMAKDYDAFAHQYPMADSICSFAERQMGRFFRTHYREAAKQSGQSGHLDKIALDLFSKKWEVPYDNFYVVRADREAQIPWDQPSYVPWSDGRAQDFELFRAAYFDRFFAPNGIKRKWFAMLKTSEGKAALQGGKAQFPVTKADTPALQALWAQFTGELAPACETRPFPMKSVWMRFLSSANGREYLGLPEGGAITIGEYNKLFGTAYADLQTTPFPVPADAPAKMRDAWALFVHSLFPLRQMEIVVTPEIEAQYRAFVRERFKGDLTQCNALLKTTYPSFAAITLSARMPVGALNPSTDKATQGVANLWVEFCQKKTKNTFPVTPALTAAFREKLKTTYKGNLDDCNKGLRTNYESWDKVALVPEYPDENSALAQVWLSFVRSNGSPAFAPYTYTVPLAQKKPLTAEGAYQAFLLAKYGSLEAVNAQYGWHLQQLEQAQMPFDMAYLAMFVKNEWPMYWSSVGSNYAFVLDYLIFRGRAVINTVILILLTLLAVLTVNPLAAYALSRFQMRQTPAIILFMLATMAFPSAVTVIPGFLLMRDLHLLNTYAALILPGVANGMSIFLLKGFFDSLPPELYEAAALDGAQEWQMFAQITLPLSKPILAVIALNGFMAAYNGWEWALVVCQNQKMWTLAVWLYQFNSTWTTEPSAVMASFIVASIPVFLVFLLCQNIILRGIILPQMK